MNPRTFKTSTLLDQASRPVDNKDKVVWVDSHHKVKAKVAARPGYAMATFRHIFNKMDKNGDARLDRHEVQWGLREDGHVLSPSEFERLFKYFDRNNDGVVDINEFFESFRLVSLHSEL